MNKLYKCLITFILLLNLASQSDAQVVTFNTQTLGTGYLPNNSSGGISFVIQNTNPFIAVLTSLSYYSPTAATRDYTLWYSTSSLSGLPTWPLNAPVWQPIANAFGVAMAAGAQTTIFPTLSFNIPGGQTYRFYLTSNTVNYTGTGTFGSASGVSPTSFSLSGVNFLNAESMLGGQNVGYGGGNFTPRAFNGTVTLNLLSSPCVGQPTAGTASASPNNPCPGTNITLFTAGSTAASGINYQWQWANLPSGPWTSIFGATTNPYLYMPPVGSLTFYRCIVGCTFSGLNDTTAASNPVQVQPWTPWSPCYCASTMTSATGNDIGQFSFGALVNPAVAPTPQVGNPAANQTYNNFLGPPPPPTPSAPNFITGLTYPISVYQFTNAASNSICWAKAWIDYNHNANFTDPGEEVFSKQSNAANLFTPDSTVFIPPTSLPGLTRMRVKLQTGATATLGPCLNGTTGEVEDYLINISPAGPHDPTVSAISAPTLNNCTDSTETLSATICNYGSSNINLAIHPFYITYKVYTPSGATMFYYDTLNMGTMPGFGASCSTSVVTPVNLFAGGTYLINAQVSCPTLVSTPSANDSLASPLTIQNFRPTPGPDYHLCQFSSTPFGQGLSVSGCSAPIQDSVTITFNITGPCNDNIGSTGNGTTAGLPANCQDAFACAFANGIVPALPLGSTFVQNGILTITNLLENPAVPATVITECRMNLYGTAPLGANLFSGGGTGIPSSVAPGGTATNFTYQRNIPPANLSSIFSTLVAGATLNIGYWESFQDNISLPDINTNAGGNPSVATLKIYYQYVPPAFSWYDVSTGGTSLYSLSPFDPLSYANVLVNNSNNTGTFTFFAACLGSQTCRTPVNFVIDPTPAACQDTIVSCEYAVGANAGIVDLGPSIPKVSCFNSPPAQVEFYGDEALLVPVNSPDTFSTTYLYSKVFYPTTGCFSSDTLYLDIKPIPQFTLPVYLGKACAPYSMDISSLISIFPATGNDTLFFQDPSYTIPFVNPHAISLPDTVYMIVKTTGLSCADSALALIDITPATNFIANQDTLLFLSNCGSVGCGNSNMGDGATETLFTTSDCRKIATITDKPNLISMGATQICEDIFCGVPTHNGQPYLNRTYEITPTNNDSAQVCLYYLQQDIDDYNAYALINSWDQMNPQVNLCMTQVDGGPLGALGTTAISIPNSSMTKTFDPATQVWSICFPVDSFSSFYCHTCNTANAALPVDLLSFTGTREGNVSQLKWITASEANNHHFIVERSKDAKSFIRVSENILSKANNGNSQVALNYSFIDNTPLVGHNYYQLQQVDIDGHTSVSDIVDVYFGEGTIISLYPNPSNKILNIDINTPKATKAIMKIVDAAGRVVRTVEMIVQAGNNTTQVDVSNLADGMYLVQIANEKGLNYSQTFRKN